MPGKRIEFDRETLRVLEQLAEDRMATIQELIDEAVTDLLKKHRRPIGLRAQLRQSAEKKKNVVPLKQRRRR